jgi:hypothetical protein
MRKRAVDGCRHTLRGPPQVDLVWAFCTALLGVHQRRFSPPPRDETTPFRGRRGLRPAIYLKQHKSARPKVLNRFKAL